MQENVTIYKHMLNRWLIHGKLLRIFTGESGNFNSGGSSPKRFL
jgi:hypothetical protein